MSFAREKRLLLGWLALLAPWPLPFNQVLEWPALFLFIFFVIRFLQKADDPAQTWLGKGALNLLGLIYMPIFALDLWWSANSGRMVTALLHLLLFVLAVKLFSITSDKEKWQTLIGVFFVFVTAMGTSSHLSISLYLVAAMAAGLWTLFRFARWQIEGVVNTAQLEMPAATTNARGPRLGARRFPVAVAALAILVLTIPIFALLPRLEQPFLIGRGGGQLGSTRATGFSDEVSLDLTGEVRGNRAVALRYRPSQEATHPEELRFKGATYDFYRNDRWLRDREAFRPRRSGSSLRLSTAPIVSSAEVVLEAADSAGLILPVETVAVEFLSPVVASVALDAGGAVILPAGVRRQTLQYRIELAALPQLLGLAPDPEAEAVENQVRALDRGGLNPRIEALSRQVIGEGDAVTKAERLERHLIESYSYTLDFSGRSGQAPIDDFLFVHKSGHCELFATAMVLMLRSEGIPARLATGFLGAERNPLEDFLIVRQNNAHAWVEAYLPEVGWRIFDPTPPSGRPSIAPQDLRLLAQQLWDFVLFRWDRYVLTYGAEDQSQLWQSARAWLRDWLAQLKSIAGTGPTSAPALPPAVDTQEEPAAVAPATTSRTLIVGVFLIWATALVALWRLRRLPTATEVFVGLRRAVGLPDDTTVAPLEVGRRLSARMPAETATLDRVLALYLRESFGDQKLERIERIELRNARNALSRALKIAQRHERRRVFRRQKITLPTP